MIVRFSFPWSGIRGYWICGDSLARLMFCTWPVHPLSHSRWDCCVEKRS